MREELGGASVAELGKALGERWRAMGDEEKASWADKAAAEKARREAAGRALLGAGATPLHAGCR